MSRIYERRAEPLRGLGNLGEYYAKKVMQKTLPRMEVFGFFT